MAMDEPAVLDGPVTRPCSPAPGCEPATNSGRSSAVFVATTTGSTDTFKMRKRDKALLLSCHGSVMQVQERVLYHLLERTSMKPVIAVCGMIDEEWFLEWMLSDGGQRMRCIIALLQVGAGLSPQQLQKLSRIKDLDSEVAASACICMCLHLRVLGMLTEAVWPL